MTLNSVQTARLRLIRPVPADLADLCRMEADPVTMATLGGTCPPAETTARLGRLMAHWDAHGFGWWIARDRSTGEFLGRGGLRRVEIEGQSETEVGYGFLAPFWGRGLATELARESVRIAFEVLGLSSVVSFTLPTNQASRRVMEKAGLVYERDWVWAERPHVVYRLRKLADAGNKKPARLGTGQVS